ncbi:MAG: GspE/PulE family protein [Vicinamibacterales bacterium]
MAVIFTDPLIASKTQGIARSPRAIAVPSGTSPVSRMTLGSILLERNLITETQLQTGITHQKRSGGRLGQALVNLGYMTPDGILAALRDQLDVATTRVNANTVSSEAIQALPEKVARKHTAFPLMKKGATLVVAMATPKDLSALDDLRFAAGCEIEIMLALEGEINAAIDQYYRDELFSTQVDDSAGDVVIESVALQMSVKDEAAERSAVRSVERIIARAAAEGASDIHFEPAADHMRVRIRVDGMFRNIAQLLPTLAPSLIARIKVLAGMDIAEHRVPQDGRFSATVGNRHLDLRSSTYPTVYGEKAVLRLLDRAGLQFHLNRVGMNPVVLDSYREVVNQAEGMVLITGPTGSGKTTTLYGTLAELVETGKNIMTIENPVEYALAGVNQGQTNDKAGFTFARGLRALLRQDPDVIMVGEIRDRETLETAIEASLTGHIVLSTLHTNSAVATVTRLTEMGLEPYLLASCVRAIVAQRLVRQICPTCRVKTDMPAVGRQLFREPIATTFYRGAGCPDCRGTGFKGRIGIYEYLEVTPDFCELLPERASEATLLEIARSNGMKTLREECLALVVSGLTTVEEVLRVTRGHSSTERPNRVSSGSDRRRSNWTMP